MSLIALALIAPEPRHTRRSAQFPRFCLLLPCDGKRAFETVFGFFGIRRDQPDFATMRLTPASDHPSVVVFKLGSRLFNAARGLQTVFDV